MIFLTTLFGFDIFPLIDLFISLILIGLFIYFGGKVFRRSFLIAFVLFTFIVRSIVLSLEMNILSSIIDTTTSAAIIAFFIYYQPELRKSLSNIRLRKGNLLFKPANKDNMVGDENIAILAKATRQLAMSKTGAIITIERNDTLDQYTQNGVIIDVPVQTELIRTIFYPGTPLHDGAVIIRNGRIHAASVFYTPSIQPLGGQYGARHRAAKGISELTDSLTIVVSEETGRISIAQHGDLESINPDDIEMKLQDYIKIS